LGLRDQFSNAETSKRRKAVRAANASLRISGFEVSARLNDLNEEYIAGRINEDELQSTVLGWYGLKK
jgi:Antitoxin VbhA